MTRDEIYDHLAKVYLGKRDKFEQKKKWQLNAWLVINIVITVIILTSAFYGFTAFLTRRNNFARHNVLFALSNTPIRIDYNLNEPFPQVKSFSLTIPKLDASKYGKLTFSVRGMEEGFPGVMKVVVKNSRNEIASFYVKNVRLKWQEIVIPFEEFSQISDWTTVNEVSFVLEAWNAEKKKGIVVIDNISFSSGQT